METFDAVLVLTDGEQKVKEFEGVFIADGNSNDRLRNGWFIFKTKETGFYAGMPYTGSGLVLLSSIGYGWHIRVNGKNLTAVSETGTNFGIDGI